MSPLGLSEKQTSIATLEQAELVIRRAGIVQDELVEGKTVAAVMWAEYQRRDGLYPKTD